MNECDRDVAAFVGFFARSQVKMRLTSHPRFLAILSSISIMVAGAQAETVIRLPGSDFAGGGKDKFGASQKGEQTNYVYAHPTGA